ncbi:hypothetical protein NIES2101_17105 [Calothrix sp. HK-06]|nr:hypothetical protein NIES2101_17105 [Calothrix sp. HK-06]
MSNKFTTQDFVIAISARDLNPTMLNVDFLRYGGVLPIDWELARAPIYTNRASQIVFTNGVNILTEGNRIIFAEPIINKSFASILTPNIAQKYAESLPNMKFEVVDINIRGYLAFEDSSSAREYVSGKLLSNASWQTENMRASLNLAYEYEENLLGLNITEATLQGDENEIVTPIVMFTGRYNYQLKGENNQEIIAHLGQIVANSQTNLNRYFELIDTKFLSSEELIAEDTQVHNLFAMSV